MTSLFMGSIVRTGVPADESVVRNTATPVELDAPAAEQTDAPMPGEVETDHNPHLGMVNRQLASHVTGAQKYVPGWLDDVNNNHEGNDIINRQVSSSGTAAAREATGAWGHGTMMIVEGIEPVADLIDGGRMSNTYFAANDPKIQSSAGNFMSIAPGQDHTVPGLVADSGKTLSRDAQRAANAPLYDAFLNGGYN